MRIIEITEDKVRDLAGCAEKMLHYGGMMMHCIEEIKESGHMGERGGYGNRYGERDDMMGARGGYGNREYDSYGERGDNGESYMGERRGVRGTGPYGRRW